LHGFGVGDVSSFIGDCDEGEFEDGTNKDLSSQTLRTAAIVAAVAAAAKEQAQEHSLADCESFSDRRQDADEGVRIFQDSSGGNNDSLEDVGEVDDNADVVVRKNSRNRPSIRRTCRITEEDDDDEDEDDGDQDIDREDQELDDEEPEGTTIDIDEQEQQEQGESAEEGDEDDDEDVDEYFEEEEDDTQAFSPFYSSSAELIDNFGGGAGKFFNFKVI